MLDQFRLARVVIYVWLPFICFCLLTFYFPLFGFSGYDNQRIIEIGIILITHLLLFDKVVFSQYFQSISHISFRIRMLLILVVLSAIFSATFSEHALYAWSDLLHHAVLVNVIFILSSVFFLMPISRVVVGSFMVLGFAFVLFSFLIGSAAAIWSYTHVNPWLVYPNVINIRFLSQFHILFIFILPILIILFPKRYRCALYVFSALSVYMLLVGGSRGAFLSIALVTVYCLLSMNETLRKMSFILCKTFLLGGMIFFLVHLYSTYFVGLDGDVAILRIGSGGRIAMWLEAIDAVLINPLGVGPYHYSGLSKLGSLYSHPHNFFLQIFVEYGWVAGCSFLVLVFLLIFKFHKRINQIDSPVILGVFCALISALVYSLFSGVLVMPVSQLTFVILAGVLLSYTKIFNVERDCCFSYDGSIILKNIVRVVTIIILGVYVYCMACSYLLYELALDDSRYDFLTVGPRFWQNGGVVVYNK